MKKKILTVAMFMGMLFVLASCDFLSSLIAAKGFYEEYQDYSAVYTEATQYTVLTETNLTISDTDVVGLTDIASSVYVMYDKNSTFLYVEQTIGEESKNSLYENDGELYIEYLIEGDVVTPTLPAAEDRYDTSISGNMFNSNFNYQDVSGELKIDTHAYQFDVFLNQAVNLDVLSDFVNQLAVFGGDLSSFDDALAHVVIEFTSEESIIDVNVSVTDYTITFEDQTHVTLTLTNHTVLMIPDDFAFPDVFNDPYQMVAVDNIDLARRVYEVNDSILYPTLSGSNGWVQLSLTEGIYALAATNPQFIVEVYDADGNIVETFSNEEYIKVFMVTEETGSYYLYIYALADTLVDINILELDSEGDVVTTVTTTQVVTTMTTTEPITTDSTSSVTEH